MARILMTSSLCLGTLSTTSVDCQVDIFKPSFLSKLPLSAETSLLLMEHTYPNVPPHFLCCSRQVARYERRKGGRGQVAGNHASCKQRGSLGRQRKAGTSRLTGNHTFWGDQCPGSRQRNGGKAGISRVQM